MYTCMKRLLAACPVIALTLTLLVAPGAAVSAAEPVRIAVIGGIQRCGVWEKLVPRIEAATGLAIETYDPGNKDVVIPPFRSGAVDLLLIHGGDETFALQADGTAAPLRVWAANEHIIAGPADDPAGIAGAADGVEALRRIASTRSAFVTNRDPGSHAIVQRLLRKGGIAPDASWVMPDESPYPQAILAYAAARHAYVVTGHIPVAFGKQSAEGMRVWLKGDPAMRRHYVAVEPGPAHPASAPARQRARQVADFLTSPAGQAAIEAADRDAGGQWIFPAIGR